MIFEQIRNKILCDFLKTHKRLQNRMIYIDITPKLTYNIDTNRNNFGRFIIQTMSNYFEMTSIGYINKKGKLAGFNIGCFNCYRIYRTEEDKIEQEHKLVKEVDSSMKEMFEAVILYAMQEKGINVQFKGGKYLEQNMMEHIKEESIKIAKDKKEHTVTFSDKSGSFSRIKINPKKKRK